MAGCQAPLLLPPESPAVTYTDVLEVPLISLGPRPNSQKSPGPFLEATKTAPLPQPYLILTAPNASDLTVACFFPKACYIKITSEISSGWSSEVTGSHGPNSPASPRRIGCPPLFPELAPRLPAYGTLGRL